MVRSFYKENFYIPKDEKISEKTMLMRVVATVVTVVLCLVGMSFTAYAYFSHDITSGFNTIKAANFEADAVISVTENVSNTPIEVEKLPNASYTAKLMAGKIYTVTLNESVDSTAKTGFCIVTALGCADTFHTQQIGADETVSGGFTDKVSFQLKPTADTTVTFTSHWGTSSYYADYAQNGENDRLYITNEDVGNNKVVMIINGISEADCDAALQSQSDLPDSNESSTPDDNQGGTKPDVEDTDSVSANPSTTQENTETQSAIENSETTDEPTTTTEVNE